MAASATTSYLVLQAVPPPVCFVLVGYCALLAAMSVVDLEEKLLPKGLWLALVPVVLLVNIVIPSSIGETTPLAGATATVLGALISALVIFAMVELGKVLFGKVSMDFDPAEKYELRQKEEGWVMLSGEEEMMLAEVMMRPSDSILITEPTGLQIRIWENEWQNPDGAPRQPISPYEGTAKSLTLPREAMGMGDVKFMFLAGAMLGWEGGLFSIFAGAVIGTVVGLGARLIKGHTEIPFIPFLAAGMVLFMLWQNDVREAFSTALWGH